MNPASTPALGPVEDLASLGSPDGALAIATTAASPARGGAAEERSEWAHARLAFAVDEALAGRYEQALEVVREVVGKMQGQPLGEDALRGEDAIRRRMELGGLNPEGEVFRVVKHLATDDMRGTRWSRLFS